MRTINVNVRTKVIIVVFLIVAVLMVEVFIVVADTAVEVSIVVAGTAVDGKVFVKQLVKLHFLVAK